MPRAKSLYSARRAIGYGRAPLSSNDQRRNIDLLCRQWRHTDSHCQRDHPIDASGRLALTRLAIAGVVERDDGIGDAHGQYRMIAVRKFALEQDLLKITQRWRHALHALAEFDKMILDELLAHTRLEKPR